MEAIYYVLQVKTYTFRAIQAVHNAKYLGVGLGLTLALAVMVPDYIDPAKGGLAGRECCPDYVTGPFL